MTAVMTNAHVAHLAGPDSAISDAHWVSGPTLAELQSLKNISAATKVDGTDFNVEASDQVDDRSFADQAGAQSRGFTQASGNVEIYTPGRNENTGIVAETWDILGSPRTRLAYAQRFVKPQASPVAAGDELNIFRVITDDRQHNRNDASRTLGRGLVLQDNAIINYIAPAAVPNPVTVAPLTAGAITVAMGDVLFLKATYQGRNVTVGAEYVSSDESVFIVTNGGVIIPVGAGEAELSVTVLGSAVGTPIDVTVTA
ncbi:hypothetical protein MRBLMI12_000510 [Microbacterium sp. LMI12-1-1.1]|uniref:phage tail tube protein n=1 Tax=Microbacterium sp. LMI12-1-1.1 TaxID=3135225 RepID=UPI00344A66F6